VDQGIYEILDLLTAELGHRLAIQVYRLFLLCFFFCGCFRNFSCRVCIETIGFFKIALSFSYFLTDPCNDFIYLVASVRFDQNLPPVFSCCAVWIELCRLDAGLLGQPSDFCFVIDQVSEQLPQIG